MPKGKLRESPTATQAAADPQETPFRVPSMAGVAWTAQALPFHRSASVASEPGMLYEPTAVHAAGAVHDTLSRTKSVPPAGLGTGCIRQAVPFHDSASGSATGCVAVGNFLNFPFGIAALAMTWQDGTWKLRQTPFVPGAFTALYGVSCRSPGACAAVGGYHNGTGLSLPLAEAWNGTAWTPQTAATPRGGDGSILAGVAVGQAAGFTAVGNQLNSAQVATPLAETGPG